MMAGNGLALGAGRYSPRHDPAHRIVERGGATFAQRTHDVALRDDADNAAIHAQNQRRADTPFGEQRDNGGKRGVGFNTDDLAALGRENNADSHRSLPNLRGQGLRKRRSRDGEGNIFNVRVGAEFLTASA